MLNLCAVADKRVAIGRQVFFSFHYQQDIWRVSRVRNSWVTQDRATNSFMDAASWESVKKKGPASIKGWIDRQLPGAILLLENVRKLTDRIPERSDIPCPLARRLLARDKLVVGLPDRPLLQSRFELQEKLDRFDQTRATRLELVLGNQKLHPILVRNA